jgi:hypothetical protein
MPELRIKIHAVTEWKDAPKSDLTLVGADILESGTDGGRPAVYLRFVDPEGKEHIASTTARLMDGLNGAIIGAQRRWENNKKNN